MAQLPERPGMVLLHFHGQIAPCDIYCHYVLPHRPFTTQVHGHEEGESCEWRYCFYRPTLLGLLLKPFRRR